MRDSHKPQVLFVLRSGTGRARQGEEGKCFINKTPRINQKFRLTHLQCKFLDKLHHSRRHRLRSYRYDECTIGEAGMVSLSSVRLSAAVCLQS